MEFLEGFEYRDGRLAAKLTTPAGIEYLDDMALLRTRGLPEAKSRKVYNHTLNFNELEVTSMDAYIEGIGINSDSRNHDVFSYRTPKTTFLIPALALTRGLFPLAPPSFTSLFSPRALLEMCIPLEKNSQWTIEMSSYVYKPKKCAVSLPMRESLTWASLYESAEIAWNSVYKGACHGKMKINLPHATAKVLLQGVEDKTKNTIYVSVFKVSALLAHCKQHSFAQGAPRSFLLHKGTKSLEGEPNNFYHERDTSYSMPLEMFISDTEWQVLDPIFKTKTKVNENQQLPPRDVANALIKRMVTGAPWTDSFYAPLAPKAGGKRLRAMRLNGQFEEFMDAMKKLRPDAPYLDVAL